jgi:hypothetical protein
MADSVDLWYLQNWRGAVMELNPFEKILGRKPDKPSWPVPDDNDRIELPDRKIPKLEV